MICKLVASFLRDWGYDVLTAHSGEEALEIFSVQPGVRAVLTDIVMGAMSGIELADRLRQINPDLPIVFMSGHVVRDRLGNCTLLRKPFRIEALKQAIQTALGAVNDTESATGDH
jgi:two-component system NtrC family response regulator